MERKKLNILLIGMAVVIVALIIGIIFSMNKSSKKDAEMTEMVQAMDIQKSELQDEYKDLAGEFDGYTLTIHNDSLLREFEKEKLKVKELMAELKTTKSTNAKRIAELKDELATLRKIMAHYIVQIDSLNSLNKSLTSENIEVKRKLQATSATAELLAKEKETLNEAVTRAAILEVYNFSVTPLNNRNRRTDRASQMMNLQINYTIGKNITAVPGNKVVYLRLTRPDDEVLSKSANALFPYENKNIAYSIKKEIEYTGEAMNDVMYWNVEEILPLGTYRADFFADGNRIGSYSFKIEKN